ncbi:MAG: hypothetical protein CL878_00055 [Dehalococcoidia bacterium]|nr:hypothetical protein [Dehalococcoidia bacterium]
MTTATKGRKSPISRVFTPMGAWLCTRLGRQLSLPLVVTGIIAVGLVSWVNYRQQISNTEAQAKNQAASVVAETLAVRAVYTDAVVAKLASDQLPIKPTVSFRDEPGSIPLPATMVHLISDQVNSQGLYRIDLISPWPVNPEKGPKTTWEREAIQALVKDPQNVQSQIDSAGGESRLLYMSADFASEPSCVSCHNDPTTGSPKTDFKLNDIMGALVVEIPLTQAFSAARTQALGTAAGLAAGFAALVDRRTDFQASGGGGQRWRCARSGSGVRAAR